MKIIDNINTLLGDDLKQTLHPDCKLKIVSAYFSIYAFEALKTELSKIESLEFIFTSPTFVPDNVTDSVKKEHREFYIPKADRERSLYGSDFEIRLRNRLTQRAIAKECANWIRQKARFRSNDTQSPMQQYIGIVDDSAKTVYTSIQGFTAVDLGYQQGNALSNFVTCFDEPASTAMYLQLFEQIWNDQEKLKDVTEIICEHIDTIYRENSPERIYFLILYNIFSEFLDEISEDVLPNERTGYQESLIWQKLFNFQRDAAIGIINKLETYNGCILADSVGLGKTFTALAVIKYYELRNKSVLVLCPKKLSDNWLEFIGNYKTNPFTKDRFSYHVLCHTDLSRDSGLSFGTDLRKINWGNYDLVVIDESHNFRNNDMYKDRETRYQRLMNRVIKSGVKTKVLMLSATPVNNRFVDLRNQLALAYEGNSENLSKKLTGSKSVEEVFRQAQASFNQWSRLEPEKRTAQTILEMLDFDFFELLDSVTIARSRKHIQTFYDMKDIGPFPERRKPLAFRQPLTSRNDVPDFNDIYKSLNALTLSIFAPMSYVFPSQMEKYEAKYDTLTGGHGKFRQTDRERSLQALMTTNLLKRLESSVEAFRLTLGRLMEKHRALLETIQQFRKTRQGEVADDWTEQLENIEAEADEMPFLDDDAPPEVGGKVSISLADLDIDSWQRDLEADRAIIEQLLTAMEKITVADDTKLQHLIELIRGKLNAPINPGNKKMLIFTAFTDTAKYLQENLAPVFLKEYGLHSAMVSGGQEKPKSTLKAGKTGFDFQEILTLFSPKSKSKDTLLPDVSEEIDILIGTDCMSEGQNLQDCDYLVNYDIHWNPVRIIQRFGRIDRIGSSNKQIQLVNYWPDISLDEYINLKERVENRMMIVDVAAAGDDNVLTAKSSDTAYRREQLRRLQEEVIELEDVKTGISITDLGLNDFRMDLLHYIRKHGDLKSIPNGMHAVIPANAELGLESGVIFVLRNRNEELQLEQKNRLYPFYLVYVGEDGSVRCNHSEVKKLLDLIRNSCKGITEPIKSVCEIFDAQTDECKDMSKYSDLLTASIRSMIELKEEQDVASLFSGGKTTALLNTIRGLDDFELIAFLVILEDK